MKRPKLIRAYRPLRQLKRHLFILMLALTSLLSLAPPANAAPIASPAPTSDWHTADVTLTPDAPASGDIVVVHFQVLDPSGAPVPHLQVSGALRAPSDARSATPPPSILTAIGRELTSPGSYEVSVAINETGSWWLEIEAHDGLQQTRFSRFLTIDPVRRPTTAPADAHPVFMQGDSWGAYYRLDPDSGVVGRVSGQAVSRAGGQWWVSSAQLRPLSTPDPAYGGSWELSVILGDALTGDDVSRVDLGPVRAGVYLGSRDQPAIATAIALSPDGKQVFVYWARQLGDGWQAWVATADPLTGDLTQQVPLLGGIAADDLWARLEPSADGSRLLVVEQVVKGTETTGYRLSTLDAQTLAPLAVHRQISAVTDPLTSCLMAVPGPVAPLPGARALHYSLCAPGGSRMPALVTWDAFSAEVVHQTALTDLGSGMATVDGVASPDGTRFYAVNTATRQIDEIDLASGAVIQSANFAPDPRKAPSSTWDRFRDWLLGSVAPKAAAGVLVQHAISISPDGSTLYVVAPATTTGHSYGDGVWQIDSRTLQATAHLLAGQQVAGLIVAQDGRLAVIEQGGSGLADAISVLKPGGDLQVSLSLPDQVTVAASAH